MAASKKTASKKTAVASKAPAKKAPASKPPAAKAPAKKAPAKKAPATKAPAKKAPATKAPAKKANEAAPKAAAKSAAPAAKKAATKAVGKSAPAPTAKTSSKSAPAPKKAAPAKAAATKTAAQVSDSKPAASKTAAKPSAAKKPKRALSPLLSNEVPEVHEIPPPRGSTKDGIAYTKDFDAKFLSTQRDELLARRASELKRAMRLEDEAESLIEGGEMGDVQFDDEGGEGDTMVVQRDLDRLLSSQARQTVEEIDLALERIKLGTYGYSAVSGLPIPRERLEALPETTVLAAEKVSGAGLR